MIAIPSSTGMIPLKVMSRLISLDKPEGAEVNFGYVARMMIDKARNGMAQQCVTHGNDYICFIDDDQLIPKDFLTKLMSLDKDIIGTPIPSRNGNRELAVYDMEGNRMTSFKGTCRVGSIGMGATLIKAKVLKKMIEEYGSPFQFETKIEKVDGKDIIVEYSEDINFCRRAGELGFETWCTDITDPVIHYGEPIAYYYDGEFKQKK